MGPVGNMLEVKYFIITVERYWLESWPLQIFSNLERVLMEVRFQSTA